jgi:hypothetical protein
VATSFTSLDARSYSEIANVQVRGFLPGFFA